MVISRSLTKIYLMWDIMSHVPPLGVQPPTTDSTTSGVEFALLPFLRGWCGRCCVRRFLIEGIMARKACSHYPRYDKIRGELDTGDIVLFSGKEVSSEQ